MAHTGVSKVRPPEPFRKNGCLVGHEVASDYGSESKAGGQECDALWTQLRKATEWGDQLASLSASYEVHLAGLHDAISAVAEETKLCSSRDDVFFEVADCSKVTSGRPADSDQSIVLSAGKVRPVHREDCTQSDLRSLANIQFRILQETAFEDDLVIQESLLLESTHSRQSKQSQLPSQELQQRLPQVRGETSCSTPASDIVQKGSMVCGTPSRMNRIRTPPSPGKMRSTMKSSADVLEFWEHSPDDYVFGSLSSAESVTSSPSKRGRTTDTGITECAIDDTLEATFSVCVIKPQSKLRLVWDVLSLLVIGYDLLTLPLAVFSFEWTGFSDVMRVLTNTFWSLDLVCNFFVGYFDDGAIELRVSKTASRYLRSWFAIDFVIVSTDWFFMFFGEESGDAVAVARLGKTLRISRIVRVLRLVRFAKFLSLLEELTDVCFSEQLLAFMGILKLLVMLSLINHYIACGWYAVGDLTSKWFVESWTSAWFKEGDPGYDDPGLHYVVSFHWALSQFTPAPTGVRPINIIEYTFTVYILLMGLAMFSSFLGSITSILTSARQGSMKRAKENEMIRQHMSDNKIPKDLQGQIIQFSRKARNKGKRVLTKEIESFQVLPESLASQLHFWVYMPFLGKHPFFWQLERSWGEACFMVCHNAMSEQALADGDELFSFGKMATRTFIVVTGTFHYHPGLAADAPKKEKKPLELSAESCTAPVWVASEVSLWAEWLHKGRLVCIGPSNVMALLASAFHQVVIDYPQTFECSKRFAHHYVQQYLRWADMSWEDLDPMVTSHEKEALSYDIWWSWDTIKDVTHETFADDEDEKSVGLHNAARAFNPFILKSQSRSATDVSRHGRRSRRGSDPSVKVASMALNSAACAAAVKDHTKDAKGPISKITEVLKRSPTREQLKRHDSPS